MEMMGKTNKTQQNPSQIGKIKFTKNFKYIFILIGEQMFFFPFHVSCH